MVTVCCDASGKDEGEASMVWTITRLYNNEMVSKKQAPLRASCLIAPALPILVSLKSKISFSEKHCRF